MDAATLYLVLTLPNGEQKASIVKEPTWAACREHVAFLQELKRMDPDGPIVRWRCMFKRPRIELENCETWYSGKCDRYTLRSRQGCTALRWISHMRSRKQLGRCYPEPPEKTPPRRSM